MDNLYETKKLMTGDSPRFLRACNGLPVDHTPVWFMRQAGRYMPEYRKIREKYSLLEICYQPELAMEVTLQPVKALGVDAAILFADILLPAIPLGVGLEFVSGEGPVLSNPVRTIQDVQNLHDVDPDEDLGYVMKAIRALRSELISTPLIGFCGAPFTFASYCIEGGASRNFYHTKMMMYSQPDTWHALMQRLTKVLENYLLAQIRAGAQAVQVFDSWVGYLSPQDYLKFVQPYSRQILQAAQATGVPVIHFGVGASTLIPAMKSAGGSVIGLDWRMPLDQGWKEVGYSTAIQGNLDPSVLMAPWDVIKEYVKDVLNRAAGRSGHIFNLGHGVLPMTPVGNLQRVVDYVHLYKVGS